LRDLHLPAQPGLWPPAPGWWVLGAVSLAALIWLILRANRARARRKPFRLALVFLDKLLGDVRARRLAPRDFADAVNALLKRALIHGARRIEAAPLSGAAWLSYLDRVVGSDVFTNGTGASLGQRRFAPDVSVDPDALHAAARTALRAAQRMAAT